MMQLVKYQNPTVCYALLTNKMYQVGRKEGDITSPDDFSVSRRHARIRVEHPVENLGNPHLKPTVYLIDDGSKYGTFVPQERIVDNIPLCSGEEICISDGDRIRFGRKNCDFRLIYLPLVLLPSNCDLSEEVKESVERLGGHVVESWSSDVTHIVMEEFIMTRKAANGLLANKSIVTPAYITALENAFEQGCFQLNENDYLPPAGEPCLESVDKELLFPNSSRAALFTGKTFLFRTNAELEEWKTSILITGGNVKLIDEVEIQNIKSLQYIIVGKYEDDWFSGEQKIRNKEILEKYELHGKRLVFPEEIVWASIYCSKQQFCNPAYDLYPNRPKFIGSTGQNNKTEAWAGVEEQ